VSDIEGVRVNAGVLIPRAELLFKASRSGGPGGQHVNTSSTRIEVLWNPGTSAALDDAGRQRVAEKLSSRIDGEGNIRVVASDNRSQRQNRIAAEERLAELVRTALIIPKKRKKTKPSKAAKAKRLDEKKRRAQTKAQRRDRNFD
jgi:ribosome-associated protein